MTTRRKVLLGLGAVVTAPAIARAQSGNLLEQVRQRGVLRAGLSTFIPWAMRDRQGNLIGYELDVGARLAQDLGVRYEPVPTAWDGIIPALLSGRFDAIIGGMTRTEARAQQVDFSEPYATSGLMIVANRRVAPDWTSLEQFNRPDVTVAVRRGTIAVTAAQERLPRATMRQFDDDAQALQEVLNGRAHGWIGSAPRPTFAALDNPQQLYLPMNAPFTTQHEGIAIRKGEPAMMAAINGWIAARNADGFLRERHRYWFFTREWADRVGQS
jgi:polar amino acid transport system substrate-binding protein